jgi:hypothetical protein
MKKRIVSVILAFVICFSAINTTAFAAEGTKTKAELDAYVKSFSKSFLDTELYENGTKSYNRFHKAMDLAVNTLSDGSSARDFTDAYLILESAYNALYKRTKAELDSLLSSVKPIYDKNNIFNSEMDEIYENNAFNSFATKYDNARLNTITDNSNILTDLWDGLNDAYNELLENKKQVVTKTEYLNLVKQADSADLSRNKFTDERRGTTTLNGHTESRIFSYEPGDGNIITLNWGILWSGQISPALSSSFSDTRKEADFNNFKVAYESMKTQYETFNSNYNSSSTTNTKIITAYNSMKNVTTAINAFAGDSTGNATVTVVNGLLRDNHDNLVTEENIKTTAKDGSIVRANPLEGNGALKALYNEVLSKIGESAWVKASSTSMPGAPVDFAIIYNKTNNAYVDAGVGITPDDNAHALLNFKANQAVDLTKFVEIDPSGTAAYVINKTKLEIALNPGIGKWYEICYDSVNANPPAVTEKYINSDMEEVDLGSAQQWAYVYRNLLYALEDYGFGENLKTKTQLQALVTASYECDEINMAYFAPWLKTVVEERNTAIELLKKDFSNEERNDRIDQAAYAKAYDSLNFAVEAFKDEFVKFPINMNDVLNVILETAAYTGKDAAEKRETLVLAVLDSNELFDSFGGILEYMRLHKDSSVYAAYKAMFDMTSGVTAFSKGDVNGDGKITTADAIEVLRYVAGLDSVITESTLALKAACVVSEGDPGTTDAIAILRHIAGLALI